MSYGEQRLRYNLANQNEQRKYIGEEYDPSTNLNYLNSRYYDSNSSRFLSQDPVFLAIGSSHVQQLTGKRLQELLADPQVLNSYSYARHNPIVNKDPEGKYLESGFDVAMLGLSLYQFYQEPSWFNAGVVLLDTGSLALPSVPAVGGIALRAGRVADNAASIIAKNRKVGAAFERQFAEFSGLTKNTERIPSKTGTANYRIPDFQDKSGNIIETKGVKYQSATNQVKDTALHAQSISKTYTIVTQSYTQISSKLQELSKQLNILIKSLYGIKKK